MGIYAERSGFGRVLLFFSHGLDVSLLKRLTGSLRSSGVEILQQTEVSSVSFEKATELFRQSPVNAEVVIGFGGGKALDVAKYIAFLLRLPYLSVPTSLSNDGFCSPQSSLTVEDRRRSMASAMPFGVILDTAVCLNAPEILWHSGVGDLVSKNLRQSRIGRWPSMRWELTLTILPPCFRIPVFISSWPDPSVAQRV